MFIDNHRLSCAHDCLTRMNIKSMNTYLFGLILDDGADEPFDCVNVTCPDEYFKCSSSGKCIPLDKVCDNFHDCPIIDRMKGISEDETSQACSKTCFLDRYCSNKFYSIEDFVLNQYANQTSSTPIPSSIPITCESADLFRCKTSHFCINRTYVCE
jgi:hypothetical protein